LSISGASNYINDEVGGSGEDEGRSDSFAACVCGVLGQEGGYT